MCALQAAGQSHIAATATRNETHPPPPAKPRNPRAQRAHGGGDTQGPRRDRRLGKGHSPGGELCRLHKGNKKQVPSTCSARPRGVVDDDPRRRGLLVSVVRVVAASENWQTCMKKGMDCPNCVCTTGAESRVVVSVMTTSVLGWQE